MTDTEKIAMLQQLTGETDTALLGVYLGGAAEAVLNRLYPFASNVVGADVPDRYARKQVQVALHAYEKRGAEGESAHDENGIKRTYFEDDAVLRTIYPYGRPFGSLSDITSAYVYVEDQTYTGEPIEPPVEVGVDDTVLTQGVDYAVTYSNNVEVGTATVTVTGVIEWDGTIAATFEIGEA